MANKANERSKAKPTGQSGGNKRHVQSSEVDQPMAGEEIPNQGLAWSQIQIPPKSRWTPHPSDGTEPWPLRSLLDPGRVVIDGKALQTMGIEDSETDPPTS